MNDYQRVEEALKGGAEPEMLCATCPWDRFCITPPEMTLAEVEQQMEEAKRKDELAMQEARARGDEPPMPIGALLTAVTVGSRHRQSVLCPVFAIRLRSSEGQAIVQGLKSAMQS